MNAPTERDLYRSALLIGFTAGVSAMGLAVAIVITLGRILCN